MQRSKAEADLDVVLFTNPRRTGIGAAGLLAMMEATHCAALLRRGEVKAALILLALSFSLRCLWNFRIGSIMPL
jgi:hypothetical protein